MKNKLDLSLGKEENVRIKIGEFSQNVIDSLGINKKPCNIFMWSDRIKYSEKHKGNYLNNEEYIKCMEQIPNIIENPDFVGLHPNKDSIQYIKQVDRNMLVGVRLKTDNALYYSADYPITNSQLQNYIDTGRVVDMR